MNQNRISTCYFPTTTIFVDDNRSFFNGLKLSLDRKIADCRFFDNSLEALVFLKEKNSTSSFINRYILRPEEKHADHRYMDIDVSAIAKEIYNPERFTETAVIVVDYAMPALNGLKLSQKIKEIKNNYKIILLTGEADEKIALEAFNKGLIQRFIHKNTKDFTKHLNQAIFQLQLEYFQDETQIILNGLTQNPNYPPNCLNDTIFIEFFNQLFDKNSFTEFYLLDAAGSYLFLDFNAKPNWLVVKDEELIEGMIFDVEHSDFTISPKILEAINNKTHLLYFNNNDALMKSSDVWENYLFPVNELKGKTNYYYAFINEPKKYEILDKKILSYHAYLKQQKTNF